MIRKGIVLAGGNGSRLYPLTLGVTKQLLPVYNKPLIYYPLSILLLAGIRGILVIATPHEIPLFQKVLGHGERFGAELTFLPQEKPRGLADAFLIGEKFIDAQQVALILGDNLLHGHHLTQLLKQAQEEFRGCALFGYDVKDPSRYGVVEMGRDGSILSIEEKPSAPKSHTVATGLYFYDPDVVEVARSLRPSVRGELEITDVNRHYLLERRISLYKMGRGFTWLDAGTYESLMQASQFVQVIEERQGQYVGALEEIAFRQGWISQEQLAQAGAQMGKNPYGEYLLSLAERETDGI